LTQKSLNSFQYWALLYFYYLNRRTQMEDLDVQLERECFNLNLERWMVIYKDRILGDLSLSGDDGEVPVTVDDIDEMDRYFEEQERLFKLQAGQQEQRFQDTLTGRHTMSGAQAPADWRATEGLPWGRWT
jgi:hypothetical protein